MAERINPKPFPDRSVCYRTGELIAAAPGLGGPEGGRSRAHVDGRWGS